MKHALRHVDDTARLIPTVCLFMAASFLINRPMCEERFSAFYTRKFTKSRVRCGLPQHYMLALGMLHYYATQFDPKKDAIVVDLSAGPNVEDQLRIIPQTEEDSTSWESLQIIIRGLSTRTNLTNLASASKQWSQNRKALQNALENLLVDSERFCQGDLPTSSVATSVDMAVEDLPEGGVKSAYLAMEALMQE